MADVRITTELEGVEQINQRLKGLGGQFQNISAQGQRTHGFFSRLAQPLRSVGTGLGRVGEQGLRAAKSFGRMLTSLPGLLGIGGLGLLIRQSISTADAIAKMADQVSVSTSFLQEMRFAAEQSGVSTRQFDDGLSRLNRRLGLFITDGAGPAKTAFEELGLASDIQSGKIRGAEETFNAAVEALQRVADESQRTALASQLFGEDAGPRLANLVNQGTKGIEALRQEARDLGIVLEDDLLRGAESVNDALNRLGRVISVNFTRAVLEAGPAIEELATQLTILIPEIVRASRSFLEYIGVLERPVRIRLTEEIQELQAQLRELEAAGFTQEADILAGIIQNLVDRLQLMDSEVQTYGETADRAGASTKKLSDELQKALETTERFAESGQSVAASLATQIRLSRLSARERAIETAVIEAQNRAMEEGNLLVPERIAQIRALAGEVFDLEQRQKSLSDIQEDLARAEQQRLTRLRAELTDTGVRASTIIQGTFRATQDLFAGLGQSLLGFVQGAKSATDVIAQFFANLADVVLTEFARIAASSVFRVLFGEIQGGNPSAINIGRQIGGDVVRGGGLAGGGGEVEAGTGAVSGGGTSGGLLTGAGGAAVTFSLGPVYEQAIRDLVEGRTASALAKAGNLIATATIGFVNTFKSIFGFQTGGERIFSRPTLISVGETGSERVTVAPLGGFAGRGSGGVTIVFQGTTILDEIGMARFERRVAQAVSGQMARTV